MIRRIMTRDGDMLDALCKAHLGSEQMVSAVLDLNPGLAARGAVYEAGLVITLPEPRQAQLRGAVRLWGRT